MAVVVLNNPCGDKQVLWRQCSMAKSFKERLVGLLSRSALNADEALLLNPCNGVHSLGMRFSIDVIFLDKKNCVLQVESDFKPFKFAKCKGAQAALEVAAGGSKSVGLSVGDQLEFYDEV